MQYNLIIDNCFNISQNVAKRKNLVSHFPVHFLRILQESFIEKKAESACIK
jgi:hypothetical protein